MVKYKYKKKKKNFLVLANLYIKCTLKNLVILQNSSISSFHFWRSAGGTKNTTVPPFREIKRSAAPTASQVFPIPTSSARMAPLRFLSSGLSPLPSTASRAAATAHIWFGLRIFLQVLGPCQGRRWVGRLIGAFV